MSTDRDTSAAQPGQETGVTAAIARLNKALDSLDGAVDASIEARTNVHSADEEIQRMADDRTKLAQELDTSNARAERLSETNSEVSRRLVGAMEIVRGVLDKSA